MITLITGSPGMGKTSLMVSIIEQEAKTRPVYVFGITDLDQEQIPHFLCPPLNEWTEKRQSIEDPTIELDYFKFPPNSILVIDEAQRVYRPRPSASKVPPHVAALETHRHTGLDIYLLTQGIHLIDSNVRNLVGKHLDIRPTILGRYIFEWPYLGDPNSRNSRSEAVRRKYSPPKSTFTKYKSAELHTKPKFKLNLLLPFVAVLGLSTVIGSYLFYEHMREKMVIPTHENIAKETTAGTAGVSDNTQLITPVKTNTHIDKSQLTYLELHNPEIAGLPHTAPIYKKQSEPDNVPYPAACIQSKSKGCLCYTDQATLLNTTPELCHQIVKNGFFLDYNKKIQPVQKYAQSSGIIKGETLDDGLTIDPHSVGMSSRSSPYDAS